ncbi:hypothetical protein C9994_05945 [Marivirga lumbricoides]|uniref:RND transporter n=1 Tax=Marivirga lumbricoides TaxID=1046115 RepID=A0A2T4DSM1_9BACT|nr:hypothetical protein C9994_05945 [Marivirga lumbricoides]
MRLPKIALAVILVATIGLAPYFPEPHFFGKVRWVLGGADGMKFMDYFDLIMHGAPWVYLVFVLCKYTIRKLRSA